MDQKAQDLDDGDYSQKFSDFFTFVSVLGNGAFGFVVEAKDKQHDNEICAVKIIKKNSLNVNLANGFRKEAYILSQFKHPNIVRFKRIMETETRFFLVMECIYGGQLRTLMNQRVQSGEGFTEEEVSLIIKNIASALEYIHRKGAIHRDLKPENILLADPNDLSSLKVVDFGLSAHYDTDSDRVLTEQCGTKIYMAPELFSRTQYSRPIDIWSLGIITYQLLNFGKHPLYDSKLSLENYKKKLMKCKIKLPEHCSDLVKQLLKRMLAFDPTERYSAVEILKHPWITRRLSDQVPLTLNEQFNGFYHKQAIIRAIKTIAFIKTLQQLNNAEGSPRRIAETRPRETLLLDSPREVEKICLESDSKPSTPQSASGERGIFRISTRKENHPKTSSRFPEESAKYISLPQSPNKGKKLPVETHLFSPKSRTAVLVFPNNKSIFKRHSLTNSEAHSKDSGSIERDSNSVNSVDKLVLDDKSQISTGDSEKPFKRSRFSSIPLSITLNELVSSRPTHSASHGIIPSISAANLGTFDEPADRIIQTEPKLESNQEIDLQFPVLKQSTYTTSDQKPPTRERGETIIKIVKREDLSTPRKTVRVGDFRGKLVVDTHEHVNLQNLIAKAKPFGVQSAKNISTAQIFKPSQITFSFNPHKRDAKFHFFGEKPGTAEKGRQSSVPQLSKESHNHNPHVSSFSKANTPRKGGSQFEGSASPSKFTMKLSSREFVLSTSKKKPGIQ